MKRLASILAAVLLTASVLAIPASATALDDIGGGAPNSSATATQTAPTTGSDGGGVFGDDGIEIDSTASNIADLTQGIGLDAETIQQAKETATPIVKAINYGLGILIALLGTYLLAVTILDMIYIASPSFIRNLGSSPVQGGGMDPMMGGMGMGGGAPQKETGFTSLISDDCKAALAECGVAVGAGAQGAGGMGMGMGGMDPMMGGMGGMGGMNMGMPGAAPAVKPKFKQVVLCYLKKRVFTLVLLGVCIALFTCTCLTDVGLSVGNWLTELISGNL